MTFTQDPQAALPYAISWVAFMATLDPGDSIATAEIVHTAGITVEDEGISANVHTFVASGGTGGRAYQITSRITTVAGVKNDTSVTLRITED